MAKSNKTDLPDICLDTTTSQPIGGCGVCRTGSIITALYRKLNEGVDEKEEVEIKAKIAELEEELGF